MINSPSSDSQQPPSQTPHSEIAPTVPEQPYQLTIKRGLLVLFIMYASQLLVGVGISYGLQFIQNTNPNIEPIDKPIIVLVSLLLSSILTLLWVWIDIRRFGPSFAPQIGLQSSVIKTNHAIMLVLLLVSGTHLFAWIYRSVLLPLVGQEGIIGGGSQTLSQIRETGSITALSGFLILVLIVGPVMEELVFRGYLQSAFSQQMPKWAALALTSIVFTVGHGPLILWPMYFVYSMAWGWIFMHTKSIKTAVAVHMLSNLFYTIVGIMGWEILA